ncbi:unnamed protein product [Effrenium voratum]|uniref:J domain-containing protein n=2 Tax=Effrenium voratum TaxID=2562239 RepID=A0AA36IAW4_9DINO|nr:unnamed protein product [Effrenium voratum]CAJ1438444.1 unnamed protein product [Effrenium voratum]
MAGAMIQEAFGKDVELYELLGVGRAATSADIKKGYYKAALRWHPDKNQGKSDATLKFQALGEVHRILSDPDLRAQYDSTGCFPKSQCKMDWRPYFAKLFKPVTKQRLDDFTRQYVGSDEERQDVLGAYVDGNGDLGYIIDNVMLATEEDAARFEELVRSGISAGEVQLLPGLALSACGSAQAKKRQRKASREAKQASKIQKGMRKTRDAGDLAAAIQGRMQARSGDFLAQLEERYSGSSKPKRMKRPAAS